MSSETRQPDDASRETVLWPEITEQGSPYLSLEQYRNLVDHMVEGLGITDPHENIVFANPAFARLLGYERPEQVVGRNLAEFSPPGQFQAYREETGKRRAGEASRYEADIRTRTGRRRTVAVSARPIFDDQGRFLGTQGLTVDVTDRKKQEKERALLREQLLQSQKLEALGRLAAGIAHDFNNILGLAGGNADMALLTLRKPGTVPAGSLEGYLENIRTAVERARELTGKMLGMARKGSYELTHLRLDDAVRDGLPLLSKGLSSTTSHDIRTHLRSRRTVHADPGQLQQVLGNLVLNARDAMPRGGTVRVRTEDVDLHEPVLNLFQTIPAGSYAVLAVEDDGAGIADQDLPRVFEPFFTTKDEGSGTGLGLAVVWGIVESHGAFLDVHSRPGRGTRMEVYLPAVESPAEPGEAEPPPGPAPPSGVGRVLVVDDEKGLLSVLREFFHYLGCRVETFAFAREALDRYREAPFDLVLTDLIMRPMDGARFFRELRALDPSACVLIMSGYQEDEVVRDLLAEGAAGFVAKPFCFADLEPVVRRLIASRNRW